MCVSALVQRFAYFVFIRTFARQNKRAKANNEAAKRVMSSPNQKMPSCCYSRCRCWRRCRRWITREQQQQQPERERQSGSAEQSPKQGSEMAFVCLCECVRKFKCGESGRASVVGRKRLLTHTHTHTQCKSCWACQQRLQLRQRQRQRADKQQLLQVLAFAMLLALHTHTHKRTTR